MPGRNKLTVRELAELLGCSYEGQEDKTISGAAPLETAGAEDLAFLNDAREAEKAARSAAGCLIVPLDFDNKENRTVIRARDPRLAFARAVHRLLPKEQLAPGIHPTAVIADDVELGRDVSIGAGTVIAEGTCIGDGTVIGPHCVIGRRVRIGSHCIIYGNVTVYDDVDLGNRVILHSGVVIGSDGFGFARAGDHYEKFPQIGRVVIEDDVEIGANSTIDRAALGVTWIGRGTKIDNLVHIAHNCRIGRNVLIAAQTGIAGSVVIGDDVIIGGQVGIGDRARIEDGAVLASKCGVPTSKIIRKGQTVWGIPARPIKEYLESIAYISRLPKIKEELEELKKKLEELVEARRVASQ